MKKIFLSVLCGLIVSTSAISVSVSAVGNVSTNDIISLSTEIQTASAGSAELSDGQSQEINVYLTTALDEESSNPDNPSNPDGTSQTNDPQNNPSEQSQNEQSSKSSPVTGDIDFVLPALILIVSASSVLLVYLIRKRRS